MHDNAISHNAGKTITRFHDLKMGQYLLRWPANSPDLNPIETVWNRIKDRPYRRSPRPTNKADMCVAIREEWDAITPQELQ